MWSKTCYLLKVAPKYVITKMLSAKSSTEYGILSMLSTEDHAQKCYLLKIPSGIWHKMLSTEDSTKICDYKMLSTEGSTKYVLISMLSTEDTTRLWSKKCYLLKIPPEYVDTKMLSSEDGTRICDHKNAVYWRYHQNMWTQNAIYWR